MLPKCREGALGPMLGGEPNCGIEDEIGAASSRSSSSSATAAVTM